MSCMRVLFISTQQTSERLAVVTVDVDHDVMLQTPKLLRLGTSTWLHETMLAERTPIRMRSLKQLILSVTSVHNRVLGY